MATAVGLCGDLDDAHDIAQESLVLAIRNIAALEDPAAFPGWLLRLVRTATNRWARRRRHPTASLDAAPGDDSSSPVAATAGSPEEAVASLAEAAQVRAAVEQLPEGERCIVALHYLAGMPYADVAEFLNISIPAARERAWTARARMKETLPMVTDALAAARPSRTNQFRDTILVFQAIRHRDAGMLARLTHDPTLALVSEDWSEARLRIWTLVLRARHRTCSSCRLHRPAARPPPRRSRSTSEWRLRLRRPRVLSPPQ